MFEDIHIPSSFSLLKKGNASFLLKEEYKELLLKHGIDDLNTFLKKCSQASSYFKGRTPHPSVPLGEGKRMVMRQYSHGGLLRVITGSLFIFGARSFKELALTEEVRASGIPTIEPIGAIHQIVVSPFYRAYFLSLEISDAKDLIRYFKENGPPYSPENLLHKRTMIKTAGIRLRQFHQSGFYHNDLQLKNLLVVGNQILIIDFDRSYRKERLSRRERIRNLLRLNRSVEKRKRSGLPITRTDRLRFMKAYAGEDQRILKAIRTALWTHAVELFFHRIGWMVQDMARKS